MIFRYFFDLRMLVIFFVLFFWFPRSDLRAEQEFKGSHNPTLEQVSQSEGNLLDINASVNMGLVKESSFVVAKDKPSGLYLFFVICGVLAAALLLGKNYLADRGKKFKKIEEALLESAKRYIQLANMLPGIVFEADREGNITFASQKAFDIMGYSHQDIEDGLNIFQFIAPEQLHEAKEIFKEALLQEKSNLRLIIQKRDGNKFPALIHTSPIIRDVHPSGLRGVVVDITELVRIQEGLMQSEGRAKELAKESEVMAEIGRIISSAPNIELVYEKFVECVRKIIRFNRIAINIVDYKNQVNSINYVWGPQIPEREQGKAIPLAGTGVEWVMENKKSLVISEANREEIINICPGLLPALKSGFKSMILTPLFSKDQVIGILNIQAYAENSFDEKDRKIAEKVSDQIAGAIANALLYEEQKRIDEELRKSEEKAREIARESEVIAEIGRIISSSINIEEVYGKFSEKLSKLVHFDRIAINIVDYEKKVFDIRYHFGATVIGREKGRLVPLEGTATEWVIKNKQGFIVNEENLEKVLIECPKLGPFLESGFKSMLFVPMVSRDMVIGVLGLGSFDSNAYGKKDLDILEKVSNQIAGALANALLFEERRRAEEALKNSEMRTRELVDSLPEVVFETDDKGNLIFVNERAFELFGYTREDINKGVNVFEVVSPEDRERAKEFFQKVKFGQKLGREIRLLKKDGTSFPAIIYSNVYSNPVTPDRVSAGLRGIIIDLTDQKRLEEDLIESEEKYKVVFENTGTAFVVIEEDMTISLINSKAEELIGYSKEEIEGRKKWTEFVPPEYLDRLKEYHRLRRINPKLVPQSYEAKVITKKGEEKDVFINVAMIPGTKKSITSILDITELRRKEKEVKSLQEQFAQAQKMEAIGRLASGVAHDFNNTLTIVKISAQLLQAKLKEDDLLKEYVDMIIEAIDRSANLARQLLTFSRKQVTEMKVTDLNSLIEDLNKMLHRVIGEDIELVYQLSEDLKKVKVDPGQIEQAILNLTLNSRDAMPNGGKLIIETANVELDEDYVKTHHGVNPGPYVMLSVTDTGVGMTKEVKEHIFEPFFTTKEKGKGTGLGLSTVYGVVKQSKGHIWVYSEPGKGTTFKIYFPAVNEPSEEVNKIKQEIEIWGGGETVLIVEDEEEVRKLAETVLCKLGYKVLASSCADEAIFICRTYAESIDLLLTDVIMPKMNGRELAEAIVTLRPNIKVIYMSGYSDEIIADQGVLRPGINYLPKPFSFEGLAKKVREVLSVPLSK